MFRYFQTQNQGITIKVGYILFVQKFAQNVAKSVCGFETRYLASQRHLTDIYFGWSTVSNARSGGVVIHPKSRKRELLLSLILQRTNIFVSSVP